MSKKPKYVLANQNCWEKIYVGCYLLLDSESTNKYDSRRANNILFSANCTLLLNQFIRLRFLQ